MKCSRKKSYILYSKLSRDSKLRRHFWRMKFPHTKTNYLLLSTLSSYLCLEPEFAPLLLEKIKPKLLSYATTKGSSFVVWNLLESENTRQEVRSNFLTPTRYFVYVCMWEERERITQLIWKLFHKSFCCVFDNSWFRYFGYTHTQHTQTSRLLRPHLTVLKASDDAGAKAIVKFLTAEKNERLSRVPTTKRTKQIKPQTWVQSFLLLDYCISQMWKEAKTK